MIDTRKINLEDLKGNFSLQEAQQFIEKIPYDYETADVEGKYWISSPRKTLQKGCAMCIDGALLLAALTGLRPKIMGLHFRNRSHAILMTQDKKTGLYGALGKSRFPDLQFREQVYPSKKHLARSYKPTLAYDIIHADAQVSYWLETDRDLSKLFIHPKGIRTKNFSIHYYFNSYFVKNTKAY